MGWIILFFIVCWLIPIVGKVYVAIWGTEEDKERLHRHEMREQEKKLAEFQLRAAERERKMNSLSHKLGHKAAEVGVHAVIKHLLK